MAQGGNKPWLTEGSHCERQLRKGFSQSGKQTQEHHCASVLSPPGLFHLYHDKQAGMQHRNQGNPFGLLSKGRHGPVVSVGRLLGVPACLFFPPAVHNCLIAIKFETSVFQHSQRASELKRLLGINLSQLPVIIFPSLSHSKQAQ